MPLPQPADLLAARRRVLSHPARLLVWADVCTAARRPLLVSEIRQHTDLPAWAVADALAQLHRVRLIERVRLVDGYAWRASDLDPSQHRLQPCPQPGDQQRAWTDRSTRDMDT